MVTAVFAACVAALVACGFTLLVAHRSRRDAERRLQLVLERVDVHLAGISESVESAVERVVAVQRHRTPQPTLDLAELLEILADEVAARTGADAVVVEVEGADGIPVVASHGVGATLELLEETIASTRDARFRVATIEWTREETDATGTGFEAAIVLPTGSATGVPGVLVAYSETSGAFRAEHGAAVRELLVEYKSALANARRFAALEGRLQPRAFDLGDERHRDEELEREVARARESGRPLSVVRVGFASTAGTSTTESVERLARVVARVTRRGDIACQTGESEVAILLPGTSGAGAETLTNRLRTEMSRSLAGSTVTVGHVEWQPDETARQLGARLDALTGSSRASGPNTFDRADEALRRDALEGLGHEVERARRREHVLAVVVLDANGSDNGPGSLGERLAEGVVGGGSVHRLGPARFALVLPATDVDRAEALVDSLGYELLVSAGITELVERDDAESVLGRAEHALWQAQQAGQGTVVVAVPGGRTRRPTES